MMCDRLTGPYLAELSNGPTRFRWTGPDGKPQVACGYVAGDADAMLCHYLTTHEMTLDKARHTLAQLIMGERRTSLGQ